MATILIADDSAFARRLCGAILEASGHTIVEACDGVEAVSAYGSGSIDVVLLDVTMPNMDGLAALAEIRRLDAAANAIIVSAVGQPDCARAAFRAGARDVLPKPLRTDRLLAAIERVLQAGELKSTAAWRQRLRA